MFENRKQDDAKTVYGTLCRTLDRLEFHYRKIDSKMSVEFDISGGDIPISFMVNVDEKRSLVMLISPMSYTVPEEKRIEMSIPVCVINNHLVDGSFDFDVQTGRLMFRMTNTFKGSRLGEEIFEYMILCACKTVDDYNDKFLMLAKGIITTEKFLSTFKD